MSTTLGNFDGGVEQRPEDCQCGREEVEGVELIPCWPCARAGFETVNPNPPEEDDE